MTECEACNADGYFEKYHNPSFRPGALSAHHVFLAAKDALFSDFPFPNPEMDYTPNGNLSENYLLGPVADWVLDNLKALTARRALSEKEK